MSRVAWLRCLALLAGVPCVLSGGGGPKIWELGGLVEENPVTSFMMFAMVMGIMVIVVMVKSALEAFTDDSHRRSSYSVIYIELMMVGLVSFLMTLAGEFGLWDIRIGCDDRGDAGDGANGSLSGSGSMGAAASASSSGSGSGAEEECGSGFSLLLFEYAHLVLFFMGLSYCIFIINAFNRRDSYCKDIEGIEGRSMNDWCGVSPQPPSIAGLMGFAFGRRAEWAKVVLALRAAIIIQNRETLKDLCRSKRQKLLLSIARHEIRPPPSKLPPPQVAELHFSMARFTRIALSNVLIHQLHVSPWVWFSILVVATTYLAHRLGLSLESSVFGSSAFGTVLGIWLLHTLAVQLRGIANRAVGHPYVMEAAFYLAPADNKTAPQHSFSSYVEKNVSREDLEFANKWSRGGSDPWQPLKDSTLCCGCLAGCKQGGHVTLGSLIQMMAFITSFYIGQLMMLTTFIWGKIGSFTIFAWLIPMPALVFWGPRALLLYAIVHYSADPPREWLEYALKNEDDPAPEPEVGGENHASSSEKRAFANNLHSLQLRAANDAIEEKKQELRKQKEAWYTPRRKQPKAARATSFVPDSPEGIPELMPMVVEGEVLT